MLYVKCDSLKKIKKLMIYGEQICDVVPISIIVHYRMLLVIHEIQLMYLSIKIRVRGLELERC